MLDAMVDTRPQAVVSRPDGCFFGQEHPYSTNVRGYKCVRCEPSFFFKITLLVFGIIFGIAAAIILGIVFLVASSG